MRETFAEYVAGKVSVEMTRDEWASIVTAIILMKREDPEYVEALGLDPIMVKISMEMAR